MPELPHPTDPYPAGPAATPQGPLAHSTPPSQRLRCPHCHNPIQLADGHSDEVLCPACGHTFRLGEARATTSAAPMRPLGKFQLLERIGSGGFGAVWKALDTALDRTVALKIPHTGVLTTAADLERFQREARAAAQLRHPGIVPVHDVMMLEGLPTIISDFVTGVPLKDLMETRRLGNREAALLLAAAADAVHYAHSMGVVHRDLKPANIMVPYAPDPAMPARQAPQLDRPLLMDFGLALRSEAEVTLTQDGHVLGTPAYMSPEQAAGRSHQADARSDVWGLGVVLYELLTGELPFRGSKIMMLMQVMNDDPKPPRRLDGRIPRDLETVCLKCLQKEPAKRYTTAAELSADLRRFLNGEPVLARRIGRMERLLRWTRRNPVVASLLATVALLLIAVTTISTYSAIQLDWRARQAEESAKRAEQNEAEALALAKEAAAAREEAQVALARSWLGPLGLRDNEPLIDAEISALWQLARGSGERQWERFVREALLTPETTRQLTTHAGPALHAAIGLDRERRAAVERLLLERMQDATLGEDHRTDVALVTVALENMAPATKTAVAAALAQAMRKTTDANALNRLAQGLTTLSARLEAKEAGRVNVQAAIVLAQAMGKTTDVPALSQLAQGLTTLSARLETKDAAAIAVVLAQGMRKTTDVNALLQSVQVLTALAARLESRDAVAPAALLAGALSKTTDGNAPNQQLQGLSALAARLEAKDAVALTAFLAEAMSKTTDPNSLFWLGQGLAALAARLESKEAGRVSAAAAAVLVGAMSKTADANGRNLLVQALAVLAGQLEPKEAAATADLLNRAMTKTTDATLLSQLAQVVSALAARLESGRAERVSGQAAAVVVGAMSKITDTNALNQLSQGLSALAARLEAKDAATTAALLVGAISKTNDGNARNPLAQSLIAVAARLESKDAAATAAVLVPAMSKSTDANSLYWLAQCLPTVSGQLEPKDAAAAADILVLAISKTTDANALNQLAQGLLPVAARLEPKTAVAKAAVLAAVMSKTTDINALSALAQGLSALAGRMEAREAARISAKAAALLVQVSSKTTDFSAPSQQALAQGLSALAARMEPKEAARVSAEGAAVMVGAMSKTTDGNALSQLMQGLSLLAKGLAAAAARLEPKDAATAATVDVLAQVMSKTTDANALYWLAQGLSALAERMEPKDAAATAGVLVGAMSKTTDANALNQLAQAVSALAGRMEAKDGARVGTEAAVLLAAAMNKNTDAFALNQLAQGLSVLAARLEPKDAADVAATLISAVSKANDSMAEDLSHGVAQQGPGEGQMQQNVTQSLLQGLTAALNGCERPERSRRAVAVAGVAGTFAGAGFPVASLALLGPAVEPLPCGLSTQQLVDLLKQPTCQDPARRVILDYLEGRYRRPFRHHWQFVDHARERLPDLDLTTPPKRPGR